jgi:hypothetical protein
MSNTHHTSRAAIAAMAAVMFSLPAISMARAENAVATVAAQTAPKQHPMSQRPIYNTVHGTSAPPIGAGGEAPNSFSTWPEGSPNYHGSNGG